MKISISTILPGGLRVGLLAAVIFAAGCDNLLDVSNPNSLTQENINLPSTAEGLKNGLLNALMIGTAYTYASTSTIGDEMYWVGSYESYKTYNEGRIDFPNNEITVAGFPEISKARYMADLAIDQLTGYQQNGELEDPATLARVFIYSAVTRITIADSYDNFVFSEPQEAQPPIGEENMYQLYDQAINNATEALTIAQDLDNSDLEMQALGVRARAKHAKGVWQKLNPVNNVPTADPLVSETGATTDAEAALALMASDYKAQFNYLGPFVENYFALQVNQRGEIIPLPTTEAVDNGGVTYEPIVDLKTGMVDPRFAAIRTDFTNSQAYSEIYSPITWLSWREMHLIVAEEAVGTDDTIAREHINSVRSLDGLPGVVQEDNLVEFIEHERRANLYLQGRRLNDMYRFESTSSAWLSNEDAVKAPGTLLSIPSNERLANPYID
jgi:hypothetical protein